MVNQSYKLFLPLLTRFNVSSQGRIIKSGTTDCLTVSNPTAPSGGPFFLELAACQSDTNPPASQQWEYGNDFGAVVFWVRRTRVVHTFSKADCQWASRYSYRKGLLKMTKSDGPTIASLTPSSSKVPAASNWDARTRAPRSTLRPRTSCNLSPAQFLVEFNRRT